MHWEGNKMPRKKGAEGTKKTGLQSFRLMPNEVELFQKYAEENGTDRSKILVKIVRELITNQPHLLPEELQEFKSATRQVMGIGRNFNQLVKEVHAGKAPSVLHNESYYMAIIERLDDLKKSLSGYVEFSKNRWID